MPNDASGMMADKKKIASRQDTSEIKEEGRNVEIPPENNKRLNIS